MSTIGDPGSTSPTGGIDWERMSSDWKQLLFEDTTSQYEPEDVDRESFMRMCDIFERCMGIFAERQPRYHDSWKKYGYMDSLHHMRDCWVRLEQEYWYNKPDGACLDLDNADDLIVYTMFFIMNLLDGNEKGVG